MSISRKEQLEFCKVCQNRKFSQQNGLICKLTNEQADFQFECDNYLPDLKALDNEKQRQDFNNRITPDFTFGLDNIGVKNGSVAGLIIMGIGIIWIILGLLNGILYFYPLVFIVAGLISIILSLINTVRRKRRSSVDSMDEKSILDN